MTLDELKEYYKDLLIIQYRNKSKARDHIGLLVDVFSHDLLPLQVRNAFDLDSSTGSQLDTIGSIVGAERNGRGFDRFIELNDNDYRELIRFAIIKNHSNATLYEMKNLLYDYFGNDVLLYDYKRMRMGYMISGNIGSNDLAQRVVADDILAFPMAVTRSAAIYAPDITGFYGFVTYQNPIPVNNSPFNTYQDYRLDRPWLLYQDAVEEGAILLLIQNEDNDGFMLQEDGSKLYF